VRRRDWPDLGRHDGAGHRRAEREERAGVEFAHRERLDEILSDREYGVAEVVREGFGSDHSFGMEGAFVGMFCGTNNCQQRDELTRIEFEYLDERSERR
jgi:hypothetical protein